MSSSSRKNSSASGGHIDGQRYLPALGRLPVTALYDPLVALTSRERAFRRAVVAEAAIPGAILDIGCGTGTLALALAHAEPEATVTGLDGDPEILDRARRKIADARIELVEGRAEKLPFADASFDAVTTTLLLHHLATDAKLAALKEAARVLKPGGRLVIADWGKAKDPLQLAAFLAIRVLDGFETTADHAAGRLPQLVADAGFTDVRTTARWRTVVGTLDLLSARR